jgi:hypothetical protein
MKDRNFGGNRKIKPKSVQKDSDYTRPSQGRRANVEGPVEEKLIEPDATMDVDDMNDPNAKKRETSRRAETKNLDHSDRKFRPELPAGQDHTGPLQSDPENRPVMDDQDDDRIPDPDKKHGDRNPWRIGQDRDKIEDQNLGPKAPGPR